MNTLPRRVGRRGRAAALLAAASLAATVLTSAVATTSSAAGGPAAPPSTTDCFSAPANARVRLGGNGSDPNDLTRSQSVALQNRADARLRTRGLTSSSVRAEARRARVTVDVRVHVITRRDGSGGVTRKAIKKQIAVLNRGFAGKTSRTSVKTLFQFRTKSIDYTANSDWFNWSLDEDRDDAEAKKALHRGGRDDLNLYITGLADGLLGYATYPSSGSLLDDGVVILNGSLPGGAAAPYNEGDTATHEVGHWMGLLHTFENGCSAPGDLVSDTPRQADGDNIFSCQTSLDSCSARGRDPVHNFMSYGDDPCLDRFTVGQSTRMTLQWYAYRSDPDVLP